MMSVMTSPSAAHLLTGVSASAGTAAPGEVVSHTASHTCMSHVVPRQPYNYVWPADDPSRDMHALWVWLLFHQTVGPGIIANAVDRMDFM